MIMMSSVLESAPPHSRYLSPLAVSQNPFRIDQMGGGSSVATLFSIAKDVGRVGDGQQKQEKKKEKNY